MRLLLLAVFVLPSVASAADFESQRAANWHQWRGPDANGVSPNGHPPVEWGPDRNVQWKVEIPGEGSSTPIVWGNDVFILTAVPTDRKGDRPAGPEGRNGALGAPDNFHQFLVICLDRETGDTRWKKVAIEAVPHEGRHQTNTFASGSPTTDGERLYVPFGSQGFYCFDLEGNEIWRRDLGDMQTRNGFGEGSSPALHKDTLVVTWDHEGPDFIAALDARTGDIRWQIERDEPTTWATPFIVEHEGRTQVIANGTNRVRSYDLATGDLIWECGGQVTNPIPTPVLQDNLIYVMTGYRGHALYAIPLSAKGDITGTPSVAWSRSEGTPYIASPLLYENILYTTKSRDAILTTLDPKTGAVLSDLRRLPDLKVLYASPVAADGHLYYTDRDGTTLVLKAGPNPEVVATNKLNETIDASPAIVGDQLFLRTNRHVYCLKNR